MAKKNKSLIPDDPSDLRRQAEEMLLRQPDSQDDISPADAHRLLHELRVHQIELEMQNDELRRAQQELEASREKYFDLYDLAPVGYATLNKKGTIVEANLTAAALLGRGKSQLFRQPLTRFIVSEDQDIYYLHFKRLFETCEHQVCKVRMIKDDGTQLWVRVESATTKGKNDETACRTALIDITQRKQAEEELFRYKERLEDIVKERTSELTAANYELEAFNYTVSHDLRAPLRHMGGFAELLQKHLDGRLDDKTCHYTMVIHNAAKKMESLLNDLLSYSCHSNKGMHKRAVNLNELLQESLSQISDKTRGRDIIWKIGKLPVVYAEPSMLKLVLDNLIANALKFTRTRSRAEIEIGFKKAAGEDVCFIKDNGVGFNMDYANRLFGVFQRLHTENEFVGTGIGLANVRRIITLHGGRAWATGSEGQGATFFFSLPRAKEPVK